MVGEITTDSILDPTITYGNSIDNLTGFAWTAFRVNYTLDSTTAITGGTLVLGTPHVDNPAGWDGDITQNIDIGSPTIIAGHYIYTGQIDYTGGTPVLSNGIDTLDFTYKLQGLTGAMHYVYTQEMIPVPEPGTLILVLGGILGLVALRRNWV